MTTTPADPGAIDLQPIRAHYCQQFYHGQLDPYSQAISDLIAAVEALRKRVVQLTRNNKKMMSITMCDREVNYAERRADAAEAREASLRGALTEIEDSGSCYCARDVDGQRLGCKCTICVARNILAATPTKALESGRAVKEVVKAARLVAEARTIEVESTPLRQKNLREALAKLDALRK